MISRYPYKNLLWIDVESPSHDEVRALMDEFDIHPIVADELLSPSLRPKVDYYENFIYLILHFPALRHSNLGNTDQEVDFIIGNEFLITVRYETIDPLHKFSKVFEVNSILDKSNIGEHAGYLFFYMIRKIYASLFHELSFINDSLEDVEEKVFNGEERRMVEALSMISRDLLNFRQALRLHPGVLNSLEIAGTEFYGKEFSYYLKSIIGEYHKVEEMLQDQKETLLELRETNDSLLTSKTNDIMKTLTIMSFSILPSSLIAAIFGMNTQYIPFSGSRFDFWIEIVIMLVAATGTFFYLNNKKWL